jgi:hypothetical protein
MSFALTTVNKMKKRDKEKLKEAYHSNKGNWEYNFFQKKYDPIFEANIKLSMKPENGFNPKNIHSYINIELSKEEQLLIKKNKNEKLKSNENLILQNYISKNSELIKSDINSIEKYGLNAQPITKEGKTRLLLHALKQYIQRDNKESVANIYLRLIEDQFEITEHIRNLYSLQLVQMNNIINELDLIQLQFTKFYAHMPPLNINGFKKFDDWQINVINNIDNNISTIVNAPTSAGKSVLSGYATTKGRVLFVVPTDALAWQMASYFEHITGSIVPIITMTYQTNPGRNEMIEILNKSNVIVGTAEIIVDYLPFMKNNFSWIVFDEIHMIGKPEGSAMEYIAKMLHNIPILALSATISNTDDLVEWFSSISNIQFSKIICTKRFFNLQRYCYDQNNDKLVCLHPLALIELSQIEDGTILNKSLLPTPQNVWDLAIKLKAKIDVGNLCPYLFFKDKNRIELDDTYIYFNKLLELLVKEYKNNKEIIIEIINSYKQEIQFTSTESCTTPTELRVLERSCTTEGSRTHNFVGSCTAFGSKISEGNLTTTETTTNLVKLAFRLKQDNKTPAIFFQKNTLACLRMIKELAKELEELEIAKYPKLFQNRLKEHKNASKIDKKIKTEDIDKNSKKSMKQMLGNVKLKKDKYGECSVPIITQKHVQVSSLQEPHPDFILNNNQYFSENTVESWVNELKKYFPNTGNYYHFIIKLLWRGIGVYAKGLPDPYLRLVQTLACQKQLAIVFSDESLVFGVSMPFRTVVIVRDTKQEDDLDAMMFHQMSGRAGRRGLDKEGNIVFSGYSWDRIKELSISETPKVTGLDNMIYTIPHANKLSQIYETNQNWDNTFKNFLNKSINEIEYKENQDQIKSNYNTEWNFSMVNDNVNHLHMNWILRYNDECILVSFLLPYIKRAFETKDHTQENNQILLAHFLCRFISVKPAKNSNDILDDPLILLSHPYNLIISQLEILQINVIKLVDNKLFLSIQNNALVKLSSEDNTDKLRQRLLEFSEKIKYIQHYCFHSKIIGLTKIFGKLLTRIWWIYHTSSPIMKSFYEFETDSYNDINDIINDSNSNDSDNDNKESSESELIV